MVHFYFWTKVVGIGGSSVPTIVVMGPLLACEEHLHITVGFSLKTDSELSLPCRFEQPTVISAITAGFKTKTGSEGPCHHLLVKNIKKHCRFGACHRSLFIKNIKKFGPPEIRARVLEYTVHGHNRWARIGSSVSLLSFIYLLIEIMQLVCILK